MAGDVHIKMNNTFLLFSCIILLLTQTKGGSATGESLYDGKDAVVVLNHENFRESVFESESAWFVEFYSSWCGHCVRFAPTWKNVSLHAKEWAPVIRVGAVNCAVMENFEAICKTHNIKAYPTLKFFPPRAVFGVDDGAEHNGDREVTGILKAMVQFVEKQSAGNRPKSWPKLHLLLSLEDIWKDVNHAVQHTAVVFENSKSTLGMMVILDVSKYRQLLVRRMLKDDVKKYGVRTFPSLYVINQDGTFRLLAEQGGREGFTRALKKLIGVKHEPIPAQLVAVEEEKETADDKTSHVITYPDGVHMQDLESSLHYTFQMEVPRIENIQGEAFQGLRDFVSVLVKYWPGSKVISHYLHKLRDWLLRQGEGPISSEQWVQATQQMQTSVAHIPTTVRWTGCEGSSPRYRGYPCSLWMLFHTLTVAAARQHRKDGEKDFDPLEVPRAMRGYIVNFFGCRECAQNFRKEAANLEDEISSADEAVRWLWTVHNRVNQRLQSDETADPQHPKVQFPAPGMCKDCWTSHRGKLVFDEDHVLPFLHRFYGRILPDAVPFRFQARSAPSVSSSSTSTGGRPNEQNLQKGKDMFAKLDTTWMKSLWKMLRSSKS